MTPSNALLGMQLWGSSPALCAETHAPIRCPSASQKKAPSLRSRCLSLLDNHGDDADFLATGSSQKSDAALLPPSGELPSSRPSPPGCGSWGFVPHIHHGLWAAPRATHSTPGLSQGWSRGCLQKHALPRLGGRCRGCSIPDPRLSLTGQRWRPSGRSL